MAIVPAQSTAAEGGAAQVTTLLGRGSEFEGKLSFEGTVRVDGKLSGEIFTEDVLLIGEGAEVRAEINVGAVVIEGSVQGNIHAKRSVEIRTPGRVRGNIITPSLFIEKGVMFDGNCQMEPSAPGRANGPTLAVAKPKVAASESKTESKTGGDGDGKPHE
ncbi:MAG TPA: polymer-forming cytoskeletal protein [Polyangia bacterium]|jgi:cytoskeletal protein CcmA (bactofilin family)